jgi:hypothetical protein
VEARAEAEAKAAAEARAAAEAEVVEAEARRLDLSARRPVLPVYGRGGVSSAGGASPQLTLTLTLTLLLGWDRQAQAEAERKRKNKCGKAWLACTTQRSQRPLWGWEPWHRATSHR